MEKETKCSVEQYSRVTGYFQVLNRWNKGKVEEYKDRKHFKTEGVSNLDGVTQKQ
jgi:ribonucleoside-triphosphate reductase